MKMIWTAASDRPKTRANSRKLLSRSKADRWRVLVSGSRLDVDPTARARLLRIKHTRAECGRQRGCDPPQKRAPAAADARFSSEGDAARDRHELDACVARLRHVGAGRDQDRSRKGQ